MKVIHVISGLSGGGAEHMVLELCKRAKHETSISMEVVSLSYINNIAWKFEDIPLFPADITSKPTRRSNKLITTLDAIRYILKSHATVLHAHMFYGCMAACIVKLLRPSTRIVFTLHNSFQPGFFYRLLLFITKPLRTKDIIFPGAVPAWYQQRHAAIIPNGINISRFQIDRRCIDLFTCAFVGRLEHQKQPLSLVTIAAKVPDNLNFIIRVAGEGTLRKKLEDSIRSRELAHRFVLEGFVSDIPGFLSNADCLLVPSLYEGMPIVILEAAASGIPIICTPAASAAFNIGESEAFVSEVGEFHLAISELIKDDSNGCKKAEKLKRTLASFTGDNFFKNHLQLYRAIAGPFQPDHDCDQISVERSGSF